MNHEDMDVMAPPSGPDFHKEHQVARLLDDYLGQLIAGGFFDDCDLRGKLMRTPAVGVDEQHELTNSTSNT